MNGCDLAAEKLGLSTSPPYLSLVSSMVKNSKRNVSFLNGVNFASGGAGVFNGTDQSFVSKSLQNSNSFFSFSNFIFVFE